MATTRPSIADKRQTFRRLHESGCFVIPNPRDIGSAHQLQGLGFAALATTSSGFAWSQAQPDNGISRAAAADAMPGPELNAFFADDLKQRDRP